MRFGEPFICALTLLVFAVNYHASVELSLVNTYLACELHVTSYSSLSHCQTVIFGSVIGTENEHLRSFYSFNVLYCYFGRK